MYVHYHVITNAFKGSQRPNFCCYTYRTIKSLFNRLMTRAVATGVKGGDDYRGPRLRGGGDLNQPKKMLRTIDDGPLLCVVTKAYHLHVFLSLANLNIQKSLKCSNKRRGQAQMSTCAPCSVSTHSRVSQTATPNQALLRVLLHLNEQIQITV